MRSDPCPGSVALPSSIPFGEASAPRIICSTVLDAKYMSSISSGNLQQMVTCCIMSGANHSILVFPSGTIRNLPAYAIGDATSANRSVRIDAVELKTDATSVREWRENGAGLAARILLLSRTVFAPQSVLEQRAGPAVPRSLHAVAETRGPA